MTIRVTGAGLARAGCRTGGQDLVIRLKQENGGGSTAPSLGLASAVRKPRQKPQVIVNLY